MDASELYDEYGNYQGGEVESSDDEDGGFTVPVPALQAYDDEPVAELEGMEVDLEGQSCARGRC